MISAQMMDVLKFCADTPFSGKRTRRNEQKNHPGLPIPQSPLVPGRVQFQNLAVRNRLILVGIERNQSAGRSGSWSRQASIVSRRTDIIGRWLASR